MSRSSVHGAALYETESSFGEDVATYATRIACLDRVDLSGLEWSKIENPRTVQYMNERAMPVRGVQGGSFRIRLWLAGHGSSTAGATAMTALGTLLGNVIGNGAVASANGTTVSSATDADTFVTAASGTFTAGLLCFVGAYGDARGGGQAAAISSHSGTTMQLLNALPATPANGDVVYSAENIYPQESVASAAITTSRWRLLTANQQIEAHGCYPTAIEWTTERGQPPAVTITFAVSWWEEVAETFPSSVSIDDFVPASIAGGSFFYESYGTATRATISVRRVSITHELNIIPLSGPGGIGQYQHIVGAVRSPQRFGIEWVEDAPTASASPTRPGQWDSDSTFKHLLWTFNHAASGQRVAIYCRKFYLDGRRPTQGDNDGVNSYTVTGHACTDTAGTGDPTRSAYCIALG